MLCRKEKLLQVITGFETGNSITPICTVSITQCLSPCPYTSVGHSLLTSPPGNRKWHFNTELFETGPILFRPVVPLQGVLSAHFFFFRFFSSYQFSCTKLSVSTHSPVEQIGFTFVVPIVSGHSNTSQIHQSPLDSCHVFTWKQTTTSHEQTWGRLPRAFTNCLTLKEVHSLKLVGLFDTIVLCCSEKLGYILHLLECHAGIVDLFDWFIGSVQAVDEFTQHLGAQRRTSQYN